MIDDAIKHSILYDKTVPVLAGCSYGASSSSGEYGMGIGCGGTGIGIEGSVGGGGNGNGGGGGGVAVGEGCVDLLSPDDEVEVGC